MPARISRECAMAYMRLRVLRLSAFPRYKAFAQCTVDGVIPKISAASAVPIMTLLLSSIPLSHFYRTQHQ